MEDKMKGKRIDIDKYPLTKILLEDRLTNNKCAQDILDNIEGLLRVGMTASISDLRYIKLALIEQEKDKNL